MSDALGSGQNYRGIATDDIPMISSMGLKW
jgi:hypothetical protein